MEPGGDEPRAAPAGTSEEERRASPRRRLLRAALFALAALAWLAVALPPFVGTAEGIGRSTGGAVATLGVALLIRLAYVKLARRGSRTRFSSPWVFVLAAVVALVANAGERQQRIEERAAQADEIAVEEGIVEEGEEVDVIERCVAVSVRLWDTASTQERAVLGSRDEYERFLGAECRKAEAKGFLTESGDLYATEEALDMVCADFGVLAYDTFGPDETKVWPSRSDFHRFLEQECAKAEDKGFLNGPSLNLSSEAEIMFCVDGGLEGYETLSAEEKAEFPRPAFELYIERFCRDSHGVTSEAELDRISARIIDQMRASGELPPAAG